MTPKYKLSYFNITGLAEPIRFLLNYGQIDFEDNRIEMEQWPEIKSSTPFGQMPLLEYGGKVAYQSSAIARHIAKQVKLTGSNDWEDLEIDAAVDTVNDLLRKIGLYHYEDPEVKEITKRTLFEEVLPFYIEKLEEQVKRNNGYLACKKLTWADLLFVAYLTCFKYMLEKDILENAPNLSELRDKVLALPNIKAYIEKRPDTRY